MAVATAPANNERPIVWRYDGCQNLLNCAVEGSIYLLLTNYYDYQKSFIFEITINNSPLPL